VLPRGSWQARRDELRRGVLADELEVVDALLVPPRALPRSLLRPSRRSSRLARRRVARARPPRPAWPTRRADVPMKLLVLVLVRRWIWREVASGSAWSTRRGPRSARATTRRMRAALGRRSSSSQLLDLPARSASREGAVEGERETREVEPSVGDDDDGSEFPLCETGSARRQGSQTSLEQAYRKTKRKPQRDAARPPPLLLGLRVESAQRDAGDRQVQVLQLCDVALTHPRRRPRHALHAASALSARAGPRPSARAAP